MELKIKEGEKVHKLKIEFKDNSFVVSSEDFETEVSTEDLTPNSFLLRIGGKVLTVYFAEDSSKLHIFIKGRTYTLEKEERRSEVYHEEKGDRVVTSPLPGTVTKIHVKEGEEIDKNQPILVIESMKMENVIVSPIKGVVSKICVSEGRLVNGNEILAEIKSI